MKIVYLFAGAVALAACATAEPIPYEETLIGPRLGESTASPGSDPAKPHPVAPNDQRVMNVSVGISPQFYYVEPFVTGPVASSTVVVNQPVPVPPPLPPEAYGLPPQPPPQPETSTSSTPVSQLPDIAPPSTAQPDLPVKGVFSPPPPPED